MASDRVSGSNFRVFKSKLFVKYARYKLDMLRKNTSTKFQRLSMIVIFGEQCNHGLFEKNISVVIA